MSFRLVCVLQVLRSAIGSVTAGQSSSGREPNFVVLSTGRHLYSAGRPSGWTLAHILVTVALWNRTDHYIFILSFDLLSFFFFPGLISAVE